MWVWSQATQPDPASLVGWGPYAAAGALALAWIAYLIKALSAAQSLLAQERKENVDLLKTVLPLLSEATGALRDSLRQKG